MQRNYHTKSFLIVLLMMAFSVCVNSQTNPAYDLTNQPQHGIRSYAQVVDGDTIPMVNLNTVNVYTVFEFKNRRQVEQWTRTKFNVKKVYPYAIIAAAKLKEYDHALAQIKDENLRKAFIKVCEKDLRKQFEGEITDLSVTQGKILMKLIDREAGRTTYEVVQQLRGSFQAAMWQAVATLFGHNMKSEYDPNVEDILIERAVKLVEAGEF
jgi:hypothetical protein